MADDTIILEQRWLKRCEQISRDGALQWRSMVAAYGSKDRAYHNLGHIRDCLEQFDDSPEAADDELSLEFAIWFHDLIYDSRASDNEQQSAEAAAAFLKGTGHADKVREIILATRHGGIPDDRDSKLMCDIDLSILGRDTQTYLNYAECIRKEYAWVDADPYREGRSKVLRNFLERKQIYSLPAFHGKLEEQARLNLRKELQQLALSQSAS